MRGEDREEIEEGLAVLPAADVVKQQLHISQVAVLVQLIERRKSGVELPQVLRCQLSSWWKCSVLVSAFRRV